MLDLHAKAEVRFAKHQATLARHEEMFGRVLNAIETLADKQTELDDAIALLIEAQIKTEERLCATDEMNGSAPRMSGSTAW